MCSYTTDRGRLVSIEELADLVLLRAAGNLGASRYLLGICGPPAAGKSTLAASLRDAINVGRRSIAAVAPMDGFHFRTAELAESGRLDRKGQPDTFDVVNFIDRLRLLRNSDTEIAVPWPLYDRAIHDPRPDALTLDGNSIVIVEGNYLLLDSPGWSAARGFLDETWYLDGDRSVIEERLIQRHIRGGKAIDEALRKVTASDLPNAELIAGTKLRADYVISEYDGQFLMVPNE